MTYQVITIYYPDQTNETYDDKDYTWRWDTEELYGTIIREETLEYDVSLYKLSKLIIERKNDGHVIKISGWFTVKEQTFKDAEDEREGAGAKKTINTGKEENEP